MYQPATADAARSHLNSALAGPVMARDVHPAALAMLKENGITPRINASVIELLFTLPPDFAIGENEFFAWCLTFAQAQFGAQNSITADVHRDQAQPHMHVLIMPISGGKLRATTLLGSLIRRDIGGKLLKGYDIQARFAAELKHWLDAAKRAQNTQTPILCVLLLAVLWHHRSKRLQKLKRRYSERAIRRAGHRKRSPSASGLRRQFVN